MFLYTFSWSASFGWSISFISVQGNYQCVCSYFYLVTCFAFILKSFYSPSSFILLQFGGIFSVVFRLLFIFFVCIYCRLLICKYMRFWYNSLYIYKIVLSFLSLVSNAISVSYICFHDCWLRCHICVWMIFYHYCMPLVVSFPIS